MDELLVEQAGPVLQVTFNRPDQRNAMTWSMYEKLVAACELADADDSIRVMVLRGAGGSAFVAGTDIAQFSTFDGPRGVEYEQQISDVLARLMAVDVPVVAAVEGFCIGGGLALATAADIRVCTPDAKFGVPIARTLGNCLSLGSIDVLSQLLGRSRVVDLLLTARFMEADEAHTSGYVTTVTEDMDGTLEKLTGKLTGHAPLTMWATKEAVRRLAAGNREDHDIVDRVYGSADFAGAVKAFTEKRKPEWTGR
ncbi:enoyl-CoA hydratase [Ornithinicoccus hortensis]|uniref:Enoyl-CoA hydratase/carnithine racemase n=1 Tax=Ornithinicoccus hortensis TaxID=82346 RepID=A0A542YUM7_9MICO|nr:enoyl-CoA hydratase [Ornithinicoccus hortensis]TQL51787.1 enoyl-CoA hydratase/carnithine racemase [Ornithinicoccus hortensis]